MTAVADPGAVERALDDAERDVLAVVLYTGVLPDAARPLQATDFGNMRFRAVWEAVARLDARGDAVDPAAVAIELERRDDPAVRIARADLVNLSGESAITGALPTYVRHVQEAAERRRWRENATRLLQAADLGDIDAARDHADLALDALTSTPRADAVDTLPALDLARLGAPVPPPRWLVEDLIARGWLVLLGAKPGVGKTWLAESLAVEGPAGGEWLGVDVAEPFRVLYLDAENGEDLALERIHQLGGRPDELAGRLHYVTTSLTLPGPDVGRVRATVERFKPDLVIVDTLASIAPTAEKDTESAAAFLSAVWHLVRDAGAGMLLLVHLRKSMQGAGRDDPLDAFRGAGHLVGAAHRAWSLEPIAHDKPVFLLHDVKARRGRKRGTLRVQVIDDEDTDVRRTRVEVVGTVVETESGYDSYIADVLTYLDATALGEGSARDLLLLPDTPARRTANDYLTRAVASGVLHKPKRGIYTRGGAQLDTTDETEADA
jgi:hypothetical protein